jgi:hypothetical protein
LKGNPTGPYKSKGPGAGKIKTAKGRATGLD